MNDELTRFHAAEYQHDKWRRQMARYYVLRLLYEGLWAHADNDDDPARFTPSDTVRARASAGLGKPAAYEPAFTAGMIETVLPEELRPHLVSVLRELIEDGVITRTGQSEGDNWTRKFLDVTQETRELWVFGVVVKPGWDPLVCIDVADQP